MVMKLGIKTQPQLIIPLISLPSFPICKRGMGGYESIPICMFNNTHTACNLLGHTLVWAQFLHLTKNKVGLAATFGKKGKTEGNVRRQCSAQIPKEFCLVKFKERRKTMK